MIMDSLSYFGRRRFGHGYCIFLFAPFITWAGEISYNQHIRPILSDRCFNCHGPDPGSRKAKLRLDDPISAYAPRQDPSERAIVPGRPEESILIRRIFAADPDDVMPPPKSHLVLSDSEKSLLREWVKQGAAYESHWAFAPLATSVSVPEVQERSWPRNEIDRFVLARLEREQIKPTSQAEKSRWLRRVSYDLNGLPPSLDEQDAFLKDNSIKAYEKVVDRLLASTRFGERMAVPWLDAVRYADSYGYQSDLLSPTWPYRDWVVKAFNENMPFDQFVLEQLAGDLLPNPSREQRLATAFNRLHRQTNEGGSVEEEWRIEYVSDRAQTVGAVFLGLTFECARCHDHKFDPITQRDFYSLSAFFNSIDEWGLYDNTPRVPTPSLLLPTEGQEKAMKEARTMLEQKNEALREAIAAVEPVFEEWLRTGRMEANSPGLIAHFTFDSQGGSQFINEANPTNKTGNIDGNKVVVGKSRHALRFTGDDTLRIPGLMPSIEAWDQYTIAFWSYLPAGLTNGIIFHATNGSDTQYHGTEFGFEDGRLRFAIKRFWPGNAIAVRSVVEIPREQWIHIGVLYDGSADANGMRIFVNGKAIDTQIIRNHLYKSPENVETSFNFGARDRSPGFTGALLDELRIYNRPLALIEMAHLFDGCSLERAVADRDAAALKPFFIAAISESIQKARTDRAAAVKRYYEVQNPVQETSVMQELPTPRPAHLLARGQYDAPKNDATIVPRSTPGFLPPFPENAPRNRLGLVRWLTLPDHPLTARVAVNRFWQVIFGQGLVATSENFGAQGAVPTHPELLDWLARRFINSGWNTRELLKTMVLSATYRQDSTWRPDLSQADPQNRLLGRGPSGRLPAEMIRDTALFASGLLEEKTGGPPVSPYLPGDLWRESNSMSPASRESVGGDLYRRSLYTVCKRTASMPNMTAFDAPSREVCVHARTPTGTPQQAFVLLNDPQFVESARVLGEKLLVDGGAERIQKIRFAFCRAAGREPLPEETNLLAELWSEQTNFFRAEPDRATKLIAVGARKPNPVLDPTELAAATSVAQAILNLDAVVWKR